VNDKKRTTTINLLVTYIYVEQRSRIRRSPWRARSASVISGRVSATRWWTTYAKADSTTRQTASRLSASVSTVYPFTTGAHNGSHGDQSPIWPISELIHDPRDPRPMTYELKLLPVFCTPVATTAET